MYVRFKVDEKGLIHLEQLLRFYDPAQNKTTETWEGVPFVGLTNAQGVKLPMGTPSGVFMFQEVAEVRRDDQVMELESFHPVPALSVTRITETKDGPIRIDTSDKRFFHVKMNMPEFITLYVGLLNKFKVVIVTRDGNIITK